MLRSMNMSHTAHVYRDIQTMQNIFINIECFPAAVLFRGALALKKFPSRRGDIEQVSHHGTFDIKDLAWIAATIGEWCGLPFRLMLTSKFWPSKTQECFKILCLEREKWSLTSCFLGRKQWVATQCLAILISCHRVGASSP